MIGFAAGDIPRLPLNQVLLNTRDVLGVDWGAMTIREPERNRALIERMVDGVVSGSLHPPAPREYPLERAARRPRRPRRPPPRGKGGAGDGIRVKVRIGVGTAGFGFDPRATSSRSPSAARRPGVDSLWQSDRLVGADPQLEPMAAMAALAGATSRIKFGMNAVVVSHRDPLVLAKECATIDFLSGGRLLPVFGVGLEAIPTGARPAATRPARTPRRRGARAMSRLWAGRRCRSRAALR